MATLLDLSLIHVLSDEQESRDPSSGDCGRRCSGSRSLFCATRLRDLKEAKFVERLERS